MAIVVPLILKPTYVIKDSTCTRTGGIEPGHELFETCFYQLDYIWFCIIQQSKSGSGYYVLAMWPHQTWTYRKSSYAADTPLCEST